jgi:hypothetical protein
VKKFNRKKNLVAIVLTCFFYLSMVVPAFADEVVKVIDQDKIKWSYSKLETKIIT